jgi:hypothetical protein
VLDIKPISEQTWAVGQNFEATDSLLGVICVELVRDPAQKLVLVYQRPLDDARVLFEYFFYNQISH